MNYYSSTEWQYRIASFGRLVDIRNFPDIAGQVLLGQKPAYLGRGVHLPKKHIDPGIVPAVVFWTKGPVEMLVENKYLLQALQVYKDNKSVVGIQLSVTGLGGSLLEPGIPTADASVSGLEKVLKTGLIDAEAITLRYDPLVKVKSSGGQILTNTSELLFKKVISPFSRLGINRIQTKFLLFSGVKNKRYYHVYSRMQQQGITPIVLSNTEKLDILSRFKQTADSLGLRLTTCCMAHEQTFPEWNEDEACLSADQLTKTGKRLFGNQWNRITQTKRSSRKGCHCSAYWDLSNIKGHRKCGSRSPVCLYCSAIPTWKP